MARKSKSAKLNDKTEKPEASDDQADVQDTSESSEPDSPVVIEAEAVDVTAEDAKAEAGEDTAEETQTSEASEEPTEPPIESEVTSGTSVTPLPPEPKRASFLPMVFGGAIAAGLGYLAATFVAPPPVDNSAVTERITQTDTRLDALSADLADLKSAPATTTDLTGLEQSVAEIASRLEGFDAELTSVREEIGLAKDAIEERAGALSERLTVVETAGSGDSATAQATSEELAAFRAELERMSAEAAARVNNAVERANELEKAAAEQTAAAEQAVVDAERQAAEAKANAEREAAIVALKAALESGSDFSDQLTVIGNVPPALADHTDGVPTLLALQQDFPNAARAALAAGETVPQDASTSERLAAFLKRQTNARSLAPKEGETTDAILSRAEAMLQQGDLDGALAELAALPDAPKAAMQDWLDRASTRAAAITAATELNATN